MSTESDMASEVAGQGLRMLRKVLAKLDGLPLEDWPKGYVRDIAECVLAAVKVQTEERAQAEWERENRLTPEDVRGLITNYLSALPAVDLVAFMAEVRDGKGKSS